AVVEACRNLTPAVRQVAAGAAASSAYTSVPLDLDPKPLIVAEEMNTTTRVEHFKNLVRGGKYDDILALAKKLVNEGSHMLDLCCAIVGEDEKAYVSQVLQKIATRVPAPVLVDSTEADVIEEGLKRIPGKAIINSINLEDGEKRTSAVLPMAKRYGAAVIALTIDEAGMALTADKKVAVAKRIFELATKKYGIRPVDLIFDALTLPISTGQDEVELARKLIFHDTSAGDPLQTYMAHFAGLQGATEAPKQDISALSTEERLKHCIINGEKALGEGAQRQTLDQILESALSKYSPLDLINNVLLDAMKTVGELFGAR